MEVRRLVERKMNQAISQRTSMLQKKRAKV